MPTVNPVPFTYDPETDALQLGAFRSTLYTERLGDVHAACRALAGSEPIDGFVNFYVGDRTPVLDVYRGPTAKLPERRTADHADASAEVA